MITITLNTTTAGFNPAPQLEAARILRALADKLERAATVQDLDKLPLRDREDHAAGIVTVTSETRDMRPRGPRVIINR